MLIHYHTLMSEPICPYVSRGGFKLEAALAGFGVDPSGCTCADLGCSTGGFTDCLLQRGAARVYAVDTAYGQLAWKLRQDDRVVVMERSNALYTTATEPCDLVTVDMGWTRQEYAVPAALKWLKTTPEARIITLLKPHYELGLSKTTRGVAAKHHLGEILLQVHDQMAQLGATVLSHMSSPIRGAKGGNVEYLVLLARA